MKEPLSGLEGDLSTSWDRTSPAPNGRDVAVLHYVDEMRFGPAIHRLNINGKVVRDRIFGMQLCWSEDSQFLAAQEWLVKHHRIGPITRIVLIMCAPVRHTRLTRSKMDMPATFSIVRVQLFITKTILLNQTPIRWRNRKCTSKTCGTGLHWNLNSCTVAARLRARFLPMLSVLPV